MLHPYAIFLLQIHGGICIDAVVVTETLDPKLHGFDLLSEHTLPGDFSLQVRSPLGVWVQEYFSLQVRRYSHLSWVTHVHWLRSALG